MTAIYDGAIPAIGNTPLIRLKRVSEETGCTIYGKAEFLNPGGSVKDRAALSIITSAAKSGALRPGGIVVEGTAGNTGIGLSVVANALGYRTVIVIPETQTQEKKDILRYFGAELVEVPAAPYRNPNNFQHIARRLAAQLDKEHPQGAIFADQFNNLANRQAHIDTTAPEIWAQTDGKLDAFVSAIGTGGTLAGTSLGLKDRHKDITIALADPMGASMYNWFAKGDLSAAGSSITEGIGQSRVTPNLEDIEVDTQFQITDNEAMGYVFDLMKNEGLCVGSSSGINIAGAVRLAREMGPGKTIVTLLCDSGTRYLSRLFDPAFLEKNNIDVPDWLRAGAESKQPYDIPFELPTAV